MKKMKKKISLFLAIAMLFSLISCNKEQSDNAKEHIEVLTKVVVNDFENSADMGKLIIGTKLGKVQFDDESTFVKSGEKSNMPIIVRLISIPGQPPPADQGVSPAGAVTFKFKSFSFCA